MTHWRTLTDREYLGAWDVPTDKTATITKVDGIKLEGIPSEGIKAAKKPVLTFKGTEKRLLVGATVGKTIAGMYGNNIEDWVGKRITLYATTCRGKGGATIDCIRVRPKIPTQPGAPIESQPVDEAMREKQMRAAVDMPTSEPREPGVD